MADPTVHYPDYEAGMQRGIEIALQEILLLRQQWQDSTNLSPEQWIGFRAALDNLNRELTTKLGILDHAVQLGGVTRT